MFHKRSQLISTVRRPFAAAGGGAWTPASASPDVWYDADNAGSITQVGGAVSQWNDLSVNGRHATQSTSANKPTYTTGVQNGKPGLLMDQKQPPGSGDGSWLQIPSFTRAQPFMLFAAFKTRINFSWSVLWDGNSATGTGNRPVFLTNWDDGTNNSGFFAGGAGNCYGGGLLAANTPFYFACVFDGASSLFRKNGSTISTANPGTVGISTASMFGSWQTLSTADGWLLDFFIIPGNSSTDRGNAESYLSSKWNIP